MKQHKRAAAMSLALAIGLSACTAQKAPKTEQPEESGTVVKGEAIKDFVDWELAASEMETCLSIYSETRADLQVLVNLQSALLEVDNHGKLGPAVAKEWGSEDNGLTWTFRLRDDVTWVDVNGTFMANCVAQDWLTSMEWILNYHKNLSKNTSMLIPVIQGAKEYYEYTKELSEGEAKALRYDGKFAEMVGIEAPDDYTIVYHCLQNTPYFETLCTSACLYPLSQAQVDEQGVDAVFGQSNETMWYNGAYIMTQHIRGNSKTLTRNESYWDKDCTLFDTVTVRMVEDGNTDDTLFMTGEVDRCDLSESRLRIIYENENDEFHNNLVQKRAPSQCRVIQFNYNRMDEDGNPDVEWNTAVANEAFRLSLYYGLELTEYWSRFDFINPAACENLTFTTPGIVSFSDGTDYRDRVIELLDIGPDGRYDGPLAQQYKEQAMSELAGKVTFPVEINYYVPAGNQEEQDRATVLKEIIEALGTDYVKLNIGAYVSSVRQEILNPHLHSFTIAGWTADYGDPENFIIQFMYQNDAAYFANGICYLKEITDPELIDTFKEYNRLCQVGNIIYDDMDARYEAQAQAEAYLISHALIIPIYRQSQWSLTKVNTYSQPYSGYGIQPYLYKNYETSTEPYTAEEYANLLARYEAE